MAPPTLVRSGHRVAILVVLLVLLAACGSDDDGATGTGGTTTAADSTTSSTATTDSTATTEPSTSDTSAGTTASSTSSTSDTSSSSTTVAVDVVEVYFSTGDGTDCSEVTAFERDVASSTGPARSAFDQLVAGPNATEEAAGASSFFSAATEGSVLSVSVADGVLTVDLADIRADISNASTSCGSLAFTSGLTATAFQFPNVDTARFLFAGSCDDFGEFLQGDSCEFARS